jgi:DegV family protein with EDD domain
MVKILVDSSSDYEPEEIKEKGFEFVPISITIGDTDYIDGVSLEKDEFYEILKGTEDFPKTSQPSPQAFLDIFKDAKEKQDTIFCILLSSELSGTCQSAQLAKNMVDYESIYIIDSLSATYMIKILADYTYELVQKNTPAEEILQKIEALKPRVTLFAGLDTLEYLCKGGRLSKSAAAIGELANIKPVITVTEKGAVGVLGKCLGKNKAIAQVFKHLQESGLDDSFPLYTIYTYGTDNCQRLEDKLEENGYSTSKRLQVGATIGSHIGPEAFGVVFVKQ